MDKPKTDSERIADLERKVEQLVEVLNNFGASLDTERRIVGTLVEAIAGKRPARSGKVKN